MYPVRALNYSLAKLSTQTLKSINNCVFSLRLDLALTCSEITPEQLCSKEVAVPFQWLLQCVSVHVGLDLLTVEVCGLKEPWYSRSQLNSTGPSLECAMASWALQVMGLQANLWLWKNIAHELNSELVSPVEWAVCEVCNGFVPADTAAVLISLLNVLCSCLYCSPV